VLYDLVDKQFEIRQGIDKYLFAQVRLLFKIEQDRQVHRLAYLEWYNIVDIEDPGTKTIVSHDCETGMAVAM